VGCNLLSHNDYIYPTSSEFQYPLWLVSFLLLAHIFQGEIFCGGKYRHNSIENDYCGGKLGFVVSQLGLVGSVGLGLGLVTSLRLGLKVRVSVSISSGGDKPGLLPQQSFSMLLWRYLPPQKHRAFFNATATSSILMQSAGPSLTPANILSSHSFSSFNQLFHYSFHASLIPFSSTITLPDTPFGQFDPVISCLSFTICTAIRNISF